jgi:hypothetical protein
MLSIMMGVVFISSQLKVHAVRDALDEQEVDDRNCKEGLYSLNDPIHD